MSSGHRLLLTFNLSGQVGDTCDSCLYCSPHISLRENKTKCKQTETLTFFYYPVFVPNTCFVLQATPPPWPPKNRQASNNQQHSQFFLYKLGLVLISLNFHYFDSFSFLSVFLFLRKKKLRCTINNTSPFVCCFTLKCLHLEHEDVCS